MKTRITPFRLFYYLLGMLILAMGQFLNTKTGLGVSPLTSIPYTLSQILGVTFGNASFAFHILFILIQLIVRGKSAWLSVVLQLPVSLVFTRVLDLYGVLMPFTCVTVWQRALTLCAGVTCIGVGTAMALSMRMIPNPPDGFVQTLADTFHKDVGFMKNVADLINAAGAMIIGAIFGNALMGVGLGTVFGVLTIGRVMFVFNTLFQAKIKKQAGLDAA